MARLLLAFAIPLTVLATSPAPSSAGGAAAPVPLRTGAAAPAGAAPSVAAVTPASGVHRWTANRASTATAPALTPAGRPLRTLDPRLSSTDGDRSAPGNLPEASSRYGRGDGLNVDPFGICISCTNASAGNNSAAAESRELRLADESLAEGQGPSNGYGGSSLFVLPPNSLLGLALGEFNMSSRADRASSEAHSQGTLARLGLGDGRLASIVVLESHSNASYDAAHGGHRDGSSSGVTANLQGGRMAIVLLHSDSSSDRSGHAYLMHLNDQEVASAEQLGNGLPVTIPKVASVSVLHAGGDGAVVGDVQDGSSNDAASVVASSANSPGDRR
jgi:hypothetical protein